MKVASLMHCMKRIILKLGAFPKTTKSKRIVSYFTVIHYQFHVRLQTVKFILVQVAQLTLEDLR
jgi:hypothetical protein